MQRHQFTTTINAPKEKVWQVLWNLDSYAAWTSAFSEGSKAETDNWKKGSKVLFTDGKGSGMVAIVEDNIPNEFMSFRHIGELKDGVEDTTSEKVQTWAGSLENYSLKENNGKTDLIVEMDINQEWLDYFLKTWPIALEKIKSLAESK
jgi:uncharacterized protein YndB with AHSA1/START domain